MRCLVIRNYSDHAANERTFLAWVRTAIAVINTEEKRCGVEALGAELVGKLTYYERWIVAFANILFRKGFLTPKELALKMEEVEARSLRREGDGGSA
jgi:hypothetical protein